MFEGRYRYHVGSQFEEPTGQAETRYPVSRGVRSIGLCHRNCISVDVIRLALRFSQLRQAAVCYL